MFPFQNFFKSQKTELEEKKSARDKGKAWYHLWNLIVWQVKFNKFENTKTTQRQKPFSVISLVKHKETKNKLFTNKNKTRLEILSRPKAPQKEYWIFSIARMSAHERAWARMSSHELAWACMSSHEHAWAPMISHES